MKHSYDQLADQALQRLDAISPPQKPRLPRTGTELEAAAKSSQDAPSKAENAAIPPARDLYLLLRDNADGDDILRQLWDEVNTVPDWVDWDQISRGQDVFYRYGSANITGLAYQSLLGGMGAARVVETLARTGGFSTKVARKRLYETTQFILEVSQSIESIRPGGIGHASAVRVRLLHAAVRNRILRLAQTRPDYYSVEKYGVPINDLDCIGTIASFSSTLIWLSLPRQGIWMTEREAQDFIALWRYVAYLMGTPHETFASTTKAKAVVESILYYEVHPSDMSKVLANNLIRSLESKPPTYASADMLIASARWLNGNDLIDQLGLPKPSYYYSFLMAGQCLFCMFFAYVYRAVPSWDRAKIEWLRKVFYAVIVESQTGLAGQTSKFDFKYIPEFATVTEMADSEEAKVSSTVEMRNLQWLFYGFAVIGFTSWMSWKITGVVWRAVW